MFNLATEGGETRDSSRHETISPPFSELHHRQLITPYLNYSQHPIFSPQLKDYMQTATFQSALYLILLLRFLALLHRGGKLASEEEHVVIHYNAKVVC